jgi:hypothetical protein
MHAALCALEADARKAGFTLPVASLDTCDNGTFARLIDQAGNPNLSCFGRNAQQAIVRLAIKVGRRQVLCKLGRLVEDVD